MLIGGMYFALDVMGAIWTRAVGINDSDQIVGEYYSDGRVHGFIATPIPEPSTFALCALGMLGVARCGRVRGRRARVAKRG